jgi:hypothetical protein
MSSIPAGSYVFTAKTTLVSSTGAAEGVVVCTLDAGGTTDKSEIRLARGVAQMQLVKTFAATGSAVVRCNNDSNFTISARYTTIIAIRVDTTTRTAVSG